MKIKLNKRQKTALSNIHDYLKYDIGIVERAFKKLRSGMDMSKDEIIIINKDIVSALDKIWADHAVTALTLTEVTEKLNKAIRSFSL